MGSDDGFAAKNRGYAASEAVGSAHVSGEDWYDVFARGIYADDRRVGIFVVDYGQDLAHADAHGSDKHYRLAFEWKVFFADDVGYALSCVVDILKMYHDVCCCYKRCEAICLAGSKRALMRNAGSCEMGNQTAFMTCIGLNWSIATSVEASMIMPISAALSSKRWRLSSDTELNTMQQP